MTLQKTNVPGYWKDPETNTVINKNYNELEVYLSQRQKSKQLKDLIIENDQIKSELKEIKLMLGQLLKDKTQ